MTRKPAPAAAETPDAAVRRCAADLGRAIAVARGAGYVVDAAFPVDALARIAISETAAAGRRAASPLPGQPVAVPAADDPAPVVPPADDTLAGGTDA